MQQFTTMFITPIKKVIFSCFLISSLLSCSSQSNKQWENVELEFKTIPLAMRPNPLWFWNNSEVKADELRPQIAAFKNAGYGGLSILPFGKDFKPEYLTDQYFEMYRVCMEEAEKQGMTLWIYDEYGFPSGTAGDINGDGIGRFKQKYPEHTNKRLDKTEYTPQSKTVFEKQLPTELIMAVVAMDSITYKTIDLSNKITDNTLKWEVPEGNWKILVFTCVNAGNTIIDYMSPEATELYIGMTHDQYYKHFSKYFGSTVRGTFFDEPTLYYADGRSWTPDFNKKFEAKYGFSPVLYYPALWYDIGENTEEARNYLFGFRSELYAEGYTKQVNDWSKKHGILATGHQDNEEIINTVGTSGDLMKVFKYLEVPGIDKIGGDRPAERFYKIVSSSAYNWDHSLVMSETYGAMGDISWTEIFNIAMDQYTKGINILIPHAVWYNTDKVFFKPELSLRNPIYADSLPVFTDYLARLNTVMQNDARWLGDIAVLYPIQTMQSAHYMDGALGYYNGGVAIPELDYVEVGVMLSDSLGYDFMFLHPEVLDEKCVIENDKLLLNNKIQFNSFSTLIIPSCKTISLSNLNKIKAFTEAGGVVIFTTQLPQKATKTADNESVLRIMKELLDKGNVFFIKTPDPHSLKTVLIQSPEKYSLNFASESSIRNIHKIKDGKNLWFFANPESTTKIVDIELVGKYNLEAWNPHTGETKINIKFTHEKGKTKFKLALEPSKSLFIIEK